MKSVHSTRLQKYQNHLNQNDTHLYSNNVFMEKMLNYMGYISKSNHFRSLSEKEMTIIESIKLHSSKWCKNKHNKNIQNLGIYLNAAVAAYSRKRDDAHVAFAICCRLFCESVCNYMLKGAGQKIIYDRRKKREIQRDLSLNKKINELNDNYKIKNFPKKQMDFVRKKTNQISHSAHYNKSAKERWLSLQDQKRLLQYVREITLWLNEVEIKSKL
eukprot:492865_1